MGVYILSNVFQNLQLQRIADFIENGYAGGGSLTVDVTGAGDMQGATASAAGVHGLVPAPQAGDNEKYLTGAGTWEAPQTGGGVDYSLTEQDTGLKWIDGKSIYQTTFSFTATLSPSDWAQIGTISNLSQPISAEICTAYGGTHWIFGNDYAKVRVDADGAVLYYSEQMGSSTAQFYITVRYTKTI